MSNHTGDDITSIRWLPKQGEPRHTIDFVSQWLVKTAAHLPLYTAIVLAVMLIAIIFGLPFVGGGI